VNHIDDLRTLCSINSYTQNRDGVNRVGELLDKWFCQLGFSVDLYRRLEIGTHRHYTSVDGGGKKLLLLGHMDTVFAPGAFDRFDEDDEWVYGAGVCDMKGGIIVMLQALREIKEQMMITDIDILLVSDEESGSDDSKALTTSLASEYEYCFVYESAGADGEIVTARKGVGTFIAQIEGRAAHAGNHYEDGADANLEAALKLQSLVALTDLSKGSTLNVGKVEGGIGANTISPSAHLLFEIRFKSLDERDRLLQKIDDIISISRVEGTVTTLSGGIQRDVMQPDSRVFDLVDKLSKVASYTLKTQERGGVSDANTISAAGVLTLDGFGPFGDGDHTIYERAKKSSFSERIELSSRLFRHLIINKGF